MIILWQDAGPCCEQTHAAFEVGLSLDQGQGVYSSVSDVDGIANYVSAIRAL